MSKCPYCNVEIHLEDFFDVIEKETKKGTIKKRIGAFKGERINVGIVFQNLLIKVNSSISKIFYFNNFLNIMFIESYTHSTLFILFINKIFKNNITYYLLESILSI